MILKLQINPTTNKTKLIELERPSGRTCTEIKHDSCHKKRLVVEDKFLASFVIVQKTKKPKEYRNNLGLHKLGALLYFPHLICAQTDKPNVPHQTTTIKIRTCPLLFSLSSTVCPLIRHQAGMSFSAPGSEETTSNWSPDFSSLTLFCVRITGMGQSRPVVSRVCK